MFILFDYRYDLPLFFLCVKTNCNYIVVSAFICQKEDSKSISEALRIIRANTPEWQPKHFMVDFDLAEISALEDVFPSMLILKNFKITLVIFIITTKNSFEKEEVVLKKDCLKNPISFKFNFSFN